MTARRLLVVTVDDVNGQTLVDAAPMVALIAYLVGELGYSRAWIASQLGPRGQCPRRRRFVLAVPGDGGDALSNRSWAAGDHQRDASPSAAASDV